MLSVFVEKGQAGREDNLGDGKVAYGAVVIIIVKRFQNGMGKSVV